MTYADWNETQVSELMRGLDAAESYSDIAARIGVGRAAVAGKVFRLRQKKIVKPATKLVRDQILACLVERPQSHPEIAHMLNRTLGCIKTINNTNRALGFVEPIGNAMNRAAGPVRYRLTKDGRVRLEGLMS